MSEFMYNRFLASFLFYRCKIMKERLGSRAVRLLCLDFAILFDVDVFVGLEDADFVFGELDTKERMVSKRRDMSMTVGRRRT